MSLSFMRIHLTLAKLLERERMEAEAMNAAGGSRGRGAQAAESDGFADAPLLSASDLSAFMA